MRVVTRIASIAALAMAVGPVPAAAQDGGQPWTASGELQDGDSQGEETRRYDDHRIHLDAGRRYRLSVASEAFDPMARLLRAGQTEVIAENDDYGESLNSRISYTPAESGDYVLRVTGFAADARGAYTASVAQLPPLPPPVSAPPSATTMTAWGVWVGALAASDPDRDGRNYDDYLIHFDAGQTRLIAVDADALDTMIQILRPADREGAALDEDDDSGPGFNPLLGFTAEEAGDYLVRVTSFEADSAGAYRLRISR
jgi:hypothetical protein